MSTTSGGVDDLITVDDFEDAAKALLPKMAFDYYRSGADAERSLKKNRKAFNHWEIWYRVLVDVAQRDLRTRVLGTNVALPVLVSPTAYLKLAHPQGEIAAARGAAEMGTIYTLSTLATSSIEDVAEASDGPKWFQLYVMRDRGLTESLIKRAESSNYSALVLTVDVPVFGRRLADERNKFVLPEGLSTVNLGDYAAIASEPAAGSALSSLVTERHDPSVTWDDLEWLRSLSSLPLLLKGVVRADDASRAVEMGVDGIIVSNHGGRQLDHAPATIDALPAIVDTVGDRAEILMDGGVRWGTDILKALALGARAVMVGRPVVWGLAVAGDEGVVRVLTILRDELSMAMALAGQTSAEAIDRDLVTRAF